MEKDLNIDENNHFSPKVGTRIVLGGGSIATPLGRLGKMMAGIINDPEWMLKMARIKEKAEEIAGPMLEEMNASMMKEGDSGIINNIGTIYSVKEHDFKPKDFTLSIE